MLKCHFDFNASNLLAGSSICYVPRPTIIRPWVTQFSGINLFSYKCIHKLIYSFNFNDIENYYEFSYATEKPSLLIQISSLRPIRRIDPNVRIYSVFSKSDIIRPFMQTFLSNYINCKIIKSIGDAGVAHSTNANRHIQFSPMKSKVNKLQKHFKKPLTVVVVVRCVIETCRHGRPQQLQRGKNVVLFG